MVLLGMFLALSCGSQPPTASPTPGKTELPVASSAPAAAPSATLISKPTLKPNVTPTTIPIKSSLGTDGWQVVDIPLVMETPMPIPSPSVATAAYKLRVWNEETALSLIRTAEEFSFADNIPFPPNDSRYNYIYDQVAVKLTIQEALHRYPQTRFANQLEWRTALANTIMGQAGQDINNAETDTWILHELENGLNNGLYTPDDLTQALNPHGFISSLSETIPNLMGRNHPGRILRIFWLDTPSISGMEKPSTNLYAAIEKDKEGHYRLARIFSTWNFTHDYDEPYQIGDHTGDRIPEIIFSTAYTNGSWCGYSIAIYQWLNDQFADLGRDQFHFSSCESNSGTWEYGPLDARGAQPIITRKSLREDSPITRVNNYKWNGKGYELSESWIEPPDQISADTAEWLLYSIGEGDYQTITKTLPMFLTTPGQLGTMELGPSYRDYLDFQLGLAYMFQGNETKALKIFQEVAHNPTYTDINIVSQAAQAYLDNYSGKKDIYRACQASLKVMGEVAGKQFYELDKAEYGYLKQKWGYYVDSSLWGHGTLCNLRGAFYRLISGLGKTQFVQAPEILQKAGVLIRSATALDVNGDGETEWILLVDTPGDESLFDIWILENTYKKVLALPLMDWNGRYYALSPKSVETLAWEVRTIKSPNGETISIVELGDAMYFFQINAEEKVREWLIGCEAKNCIIHQSDNQLAVENGGQYPSLYRWSNEKSALVYIPDPNAELRLDAESTLLNNWQADKAVPLIQNVLKNPDYEDPYFMYLLGLAYETQGNEANAVQAYWNLWQKHPESVYARLAQAKLELK
jgi:hypothetical protein